MIILCAYLTFQSSSSNGLSSAFLGGGGGRTWMPEGKERGWAPQQQQGLILGCITVAVALYYGIFV